MSEYEVGTMDFQYLAEFAVYPKGKDQSLCYCTDRARAEMIVTAMNERDLLRRQVEVLERRVIALSKRGSHRGWPECYGCLGKSDCADPDECKQRLREWSREQAKKGGGNDTQTY